ncbi:hypothetical protein pb186bvf_011778 [Paramecium bursaria]
MKFFYLEYIYELRKQIALQLINFNQTGWLIIYVSFKYNHILKRDFEKTIRFRRKINKFG